LLADAVPKKRGPKTDVLEALLKRVDGLEKRLVSEGKSEDPSDAGTTTSATSTSTTTTTATHHEKTNVDRKPAELAKSQSHSPPQVSPRQADAMHHAQQQQQQLMSPVEPRYLLQPVCNSASGAQLTRPPSLQSPSLAPDLLVDTYFARIHGKPYYILDESTTRQRLQANQLPSHLAYAIYAVSARYDMRLPEQC